MDPKLELAGEEQKVNVFWGSGFDALHVPDIWVLDVLHMSWKEVSTKSMHNSTLAENLISFLQLKLKFCS